MRHALRSGFAAVAILAASASPAASAGGAVTYTGARVHVLDSTVIDVRALSRLERKTTPYLRPPVPAEDADEAEPVEPNVRITLPSPFASPLGAPTTTSSVASPYVSATFLAQPDVPAVGARRTESPPDTNGAVGRDELMVPLNSNYVIQRKSDGKVLTRVSMETFWSSLGARQPFDPRVLYDPYDDRWLATAGDEPLEPSSRILYGISDTADPRGRWHLYALAADPTGASWADFPTLGFDHDAIAIAVNMFATGTLNYIRGRLIVLDRASLRAGGDGRPEQIDVPDGFALQPAVTYSPSESTLYLVEHLGALSATYRFWALSGTTLRLVGGAPKTNPLGPWAGPGGNVLPQLHGRGIDAGDSRIGNVVFRNGHVWYAQTISLPPGGNGFGISTAAQWVELDTNGDFVQGGRVEDPTANPWNGGHSYAFASLAVNARDDVLLGFSEFESDDYADAGYAFRAGTDAPGTMRAPVTLKDGEGPYDKTEGGARNRWGDYSGTAVDPSDDLSLWTIQEYARIPVGHGDDAGRWGTWWGRVGGGQPLQRPSCVVPHAVGKRLAAAWRRIVAAHCRLGSVGRVKGAKRLRDRVLRQRPRPGRRLPSDTPVTLVVGR
jgi:hypothetical protein